jgi:ankyrin repeat protein
MSESHLSLPARPSLEQLKKRAKELLRAIRAADPANERVTLAQAQHRIAREYGFASWTRLKHHIQAIERPGDFDDYIWGRDTWPFLVAVYEGREDVVREQLRADPTLARAEYAYMQPLHYAVRGGHVGMAKLLVEAGADPMAEGWSGRLRDDTPLARARDREQAEIVALLEDAVAHPRTPAPPRNAQSTSEWREMENEMFKICGRGDVEGALAMIEAHPGIAQAGLYEAIHHDHPALVRLLIEHGADPTIPWRWACWYTPLMHALRYAEPRYETAQLLLDRGVKPDETNGLGMAPLHILANEGTVEAAAWLLDHGADIHLRDRDYESTPLAWAARAGRAEMVRFLLARGAKVRVPDDPSWATPAAWARRRGHRHIQDLLGTE